MKIDNFLSQLIGICSTRFQVIEIEYIIRKNQSIDWWGIIDCNQLFRCPSILLPVGDVLSVSGKTLMGSSHFL